jgi:hypothetical protein
VLVHGPFVKPIGLSVGDCDCALWAMAQAGAQAVTIDIRYQPRFAVDDLDRPFCTGWNTLAATIALGLVDVYDLSEGHCIGDSPICFLCPTIPEGTIRRLGARQAGMRGNGGVLAENDVLASFQGQNALLETL